MTEAEFQEKCEQLLKRTPSILWHHCGDPRRCNGHRGLPDLVILGPGGILFAELKSDVGELGYPQRRFRWVILAAGLTWKLYRPRDYLLFQADVQALSYRAELPSSA